MRSRERLIILASRWDETARALADRWSANGACVLTPKDLSAAGWRLHVPNNETSVAVVAGHPIEAADIFGVLIRITSVTEHELGHIAPADRAYVATEMTAFLLAWLTSLRCAVVNRPRLGCLSGPAWRGEQWVHAASRLGIPVATMHRATNRSVRVPAQPPDDPADAVVTVVGQRCLGSANSLLVTQARALAGAAGADLLDVWFRASGSGAHFVGATAWPDVGRGNVADALLELFVAQRGKGDRR